MPNRLFKGKSKGQKMLKVARKRKRKERKKEKKHKNSIARIRAGASPPSAIFAYLRMPETSPRSQGKKYKIRSISELLVFT